jgi:hypothetical protein
LKNISDNVKDLFWIFLADTYIILISFALLKVLELMLRSFWPKEAGLLRTMDLTLSLPIVAAYAFLLTFDLGEYFFRNRKRKESDGLSGTGDSKQEEIQLP